MKTKIILLLLLLLLLLPPVKAQLDRDYDGDYDLQDWARERHQDRLELEENIHRRNVEWELYQQNQLLQQQNQIIERNRRN